MPSTSHSIQPVLALAFGATLVADSPLVPQPTGKVVRTIAIREDQTLEQLHEALRLAFGWDDPHLYCFWLSGKFWDRDSLRYSAPLELENGELSARTPISDVGLRCDAAERACLTARGRAPPRSHRRSISPSSGQVSVPADGPHLVDARSHLARGYRTQSARGRRVSRLRRASVR